MLLCATAMRNAIQTSGDGGAFQCVPISKRVFERSDIHGYAQFKRIMNNVNSEELGRVIASAVASYLQPKSQLKTTKK